jgi:chorismate synthase
VSAQLVQVGEETDKSRFKALLESVQQVGESVGGVVECRITGLPAGVGEPIFDKLNARLAYAVMSINGSRSFEMVSGIVGGISEGTDIVFRCRFKPTATTAKLYGGRHDVCIAVRAVPVVEAMTALTLLDQMAK